MNKFNQTTIAGATVIATIKNMYSLGHIGEKVLSEQGFKKIDPEKQYPYTLRSKIHAAAHERFGDDALFAFGVFQMEEAKKVSKFADDLDRLSSYYEKNSDRINSKVDEIAENALEEFYLLQNDVSNNLLKKATRGPFDGYGCFSKKIGHLKYEMHGTQAAWPDHYANFQGSVYAILIQFLSHRWDISFQYVKDKSRSGEDWSEYVYIVSFSKKTLIKTLAETKVEIISEVRENLLNAVLADSEKQIERTEAISHKLSKYLPPQIHDALFSGNYGTEITTRRKKLTIFFSDIVNFTATSEGLQPEDLTKYLNEYFSEMTIIALDYGATIDKYIGDAMMVFFGDPSSKGEREDARACVEMSLKMQDKMKFLQKKWRNQGFAEPFKIRMGMNTGYCNVGNFGSDQRLTYTIIGGEVNVAQRLESNAKPNKILMSYETYAYSQDLIDAQKKETIKMKGINREIQVYEIIGRKNVGITDGLFTSDSDANDKEDTITKTSGEETDVITKKIDLIEKQISEIMKKINHL